MPDPNFFKKSRNMTLGEAAKIAEAELVNGHADDTFNDVASLDLATKHDLSFLDNVKYKELFYKSNAKACVIRSEMKETAPQHMALLCSSNPYKSYALICQALYPQAKPNKIKISSNACISSSASISNNVTIEDGVVVGENVSIGEGSWIRANTVIDDNSQIGANCKIGANVNISHSIIGNNVSIYPGAKIGQDGFGFAIDPNGHVKVPQLGRVLIEDSVEIGANTCIDRGAGPDTVIGQGTWIDNLVQIGHNVKIGKCCVIVAQTGISGSSVIEDYAVLAGQCGVSGHITIGKGSRVGAQSGVMRDVPPGSEYLGTPAVPAKQSHRQFVALERLIKNSSSNKGG
jgi:UDP-3-O-[3-hydroxymyristoyl] glucosamine N-acyltransferase